VVQQEVGDHWRTIIRFGNSDGGEHDTVSVTIAVLEALTFGLGRLVSAAAEVGQRLCLLTGIRDAYAHELSRLPDDALDVVDVDTWDVEECAAALRTVPDLCGLINSTDTWLITGADLAARFGLPGPDPDAVRGLRNKRGVRSVLNGLGLSRGGAIDVPDGPWHTAVLRDSVGFPMVLKDSAGTDSRNVWVARDDAGLKGALADADGRTLMGRLFAEPYFTGPLFSAETLSWDGKTRLLGVTGRLVSGQWFGREELMSFPVGQPAADAEALETWVGQVLAAAGHDRGFAHVEFVCTLDGPELVEINARLGGCLAGEALCRSLGTNVYRAVVDVALDRRPALFDAERATGRPSAVALVYPDQPGTYQGTTGLAGLAAWPGEPQWYPTKTVGTRVDSLADQRACAGLLYAEGATTELAIYHATAAAGSLCAVTVGA
jgi:biotin carboxylase